MTERGITELALLSMIDGGEIRRADGRRLWAYRHVPYRDDTLLCAVLVLEGAVVVKTVMHRFEPEEWRCAPPTTTPTTSSCSACPKGRSSARSLRTRTRT
jgi:hypothetical protein